MGNIGTQDQLIVSQIMGGGGTPTITLGTGAGTAATYTIEGDNISGIITITTGTGLTTNANLFTITLADNAAYSGVLLTHLTSIGVNTLDVINSVVQNVLTANSNTFAMKGASLSLSPLTPYKLSYINTGYKK